jgi:hypothetical protein
MRSRVLHYAAIGVCVSGVPIQAIASLAPLIKEFASSGLILPCAFSAVTVSLKFVSFWMASAFLPSASFTLAYSSLVRRPDAEVTGTWTSPRRSSRKLQAALSSLISSEVWERSIEGHHGLVEDESFVMVVKVGRLREVT